MAFYLRPSSLILSGRWIASGLQTSRPLNHFCQQPHCVSGSQTRRPSFKTCTLRKTAETPSQNNGGDGYRRWTSCLNTEAQVREKDCIRLRKGEEGKVGLWPGSPED